MYELDHKRVGVPTTPSLWYAGPEYHRYLKVTMTCGGGMGGSRWEEYIEVQELPSNRLVPVKGIGGKAFQINTAYVVKVEPITVMSAAYMSHNPYRPSGSYVVRWIIPEEWENEIELINEFDSKAPDHGTLDC